MAPSSNLADSSSWIASVCRASLRCSGRAATLTRMAIRWCISPTWKLLGLAICTCPAAESGIFCGWQSRGLGSGILDQVLKLDFDTVVHSTGPVVTRAELEAFRAKVDTMTSRATALVTKGVPKDQLMARLKTDDLGWKFNFTGEEVDRFFAELSRAK